MGVLDDFFDLDWTTKLIGQVIAAGLLAWLGGLQIDQLPIGGVTIPSTWSSLALTLITVVVVMNMMNFIDGLDGLVAGIAIIANGAFFLYSYMALQVSGVDQLLQPRHAAVGHDVRRLPRLPAAQLAPGAAVHGRRGQPARRA